MQRSRYHSRYHIYTRGLVLGFLAFILSGLGYPNDKTLIVGVDVEKPEQSFYDLSFEAPDSVSSGEIFEVRLSLQHDDAYETSSNAQLSLTGGRLLNEQQQELLPDAVWRIQASEEDVVGLVVNIETSAKKAEEEESIQYIDTISKKYDVLPIDAVVAPSEVDSGFDEENNNALYTIFGFSAAVFIGLAAFFWNKIRVKK